ncbi:hypothetical protein ACTMTI_38255 [Nonomuraea sp. H19]|uniref:hypothetical protein n=1 Tax=Nonomuraea sp. H19 TaxID=3452206 RepID=UPI003F892F3F
MSDPDGDGLCDASGQSCRNAGDVDPRPARRIVYRVNDDTIMIAACRYHYEK